MRRSLKIQSVLFVSLVTIFLGSVNLCFAAEEKTIKIGFAAPLSGDGADYGNACKEGVVLAVEEINEKGGINGKKIELIMRDDQLNPKFAVNIAQEFVDDKNIVATIGFAGSTPTLAAAPIYQNNGLVMLTTLAAHPDIPKVGNYIFRNFVNVKYGGEAIAGFVASKLKPKRVAIMHINNDMCIALKDAIAEFMKNKGVEVSPIVDFNLGETMDYRSKLTQILDAKPKPDVTFFAVHYREFGMIAVQAKKLGFDIQMATDTTGYFPELITIAGDAIEGLVLITEFFIGDPNPKVQSYIGRMKKRFGHPPNAFSVRSYDGMYMLAEALKKNSTDRKAIRDALNQVKIVGVLGELSFVNSRDCASKYYTPITIKNGEFVLWK